MVKTILYEMLLSEMTNAELKIPNGNLGYFIKTIIENKSFFFI